MMCCRPSSGEIVALWAECVHAGFMTLADYFKHVERDDRGKVWAVYEIEVRTESHVPEDKLEKITKSRTKTTSP